MVFGTTFCSLSRLPINDGDVCVILKLKGTRNRYKDNAVKTSYEICELPKEITYIGNPQYDENIYPAMFIHKRYYEEVMSNFCVSSYKYMTGRLLDNFAHRLLENLNKKYKKWEKTTLNKIKGKDDVTELVKGMKLSIEEEMLIKILILMSYLNAVPYPNYTCSNNSIVDKLEIIREKAKKRK